MFKKSAALFTVLFFFALFTISSLAKMKVEEKKLLIDNSTELQTVKIHNEYSLEIQKHMNACTDLNTDASLQYEDTAKELYIIVIDESKSAFIQDFTASKKYKAHYTVEKNYRLVQMESLNKNMKMKGNAKIKTEKINGLGAEIVDFDATVPGIDPMITYKIAFIQGPVNMYFVMTWTLAEYKEKHLEEMNKMIHSLRVLN